jgi:FAD/FMN-containing dehydrogenase
MANLQAPVIPCISVTIQNLLVIDSQVANWQALAAAVIADTTVLILDSASDGLGDFRRKYYPFNVGCLLHFPTEYNYEIHSRDGTKLVTVDTMLEWAKSMTWKGLKPVVKLSKTIYQKGISLSKKTMLAIEARLERNLILPKWDIMIRFIYG